MVLPLLAGRGDAGGSSYQAGRLTPRPSSRRWGVPSAGGSSKRPPTSIPALLLIERPSLGNARGALFVLAAVSRGNGSRPFLTPRRLRGAQQVVAGARFGRPSPRALRPPPPPLFIVQPFWDVVPTFCFFRLLEPQLDFSLSPPSCALPVCRGAVAVEPSDGLQKRQRSDHEPWTTQMVSGGSFAELRFLLFSPQPASRSQTGTTAFGLWILVERYYMCRDPTNIFFSFLFFKFEK